MKHLTLNRRTFAMGAAATTALSVASLRTVAADEHGDSSMSVDETREVLDAYVNAMLEGGDFGQYLHEDAVLVDIDSGLLVEGRDNVVEAIVTWHTETFDAQPTVIRSVVGEGSAAVELHFTGTHTGEFNGIAATNASVNVPYVAFYSIEDGLVTELRLYGLSSGLMTQLTAHDMHMATPVADQSVEEGVVHLDLFEFGISANPLTLQVGQEYTFVAHNSGQMVHEVVIEPAGTIDEPLEKDDQESEIEDIGPGETAEMAWTFDEPGDYQYACHIPGHFELGMVLVFTVE
jgi:uncharacterized cupredoxin-like copper-binding protein/predicted ester cyclase